MRRGRWLVVAMALVPLALVAAWLYPQMHTWPHVPTRGAMLQPFGMTIDYQSCGFHTGQDWFAPAGTPIYAIEAGTVLYVGPLWLAGPGVGRGDYSIVLFHEAQGYYTSYSHNRVALVEPGQAVARGEVIAELGDEGFSGSPHLHLEKITTPFTGNWQQPFIGCEGYSDPGARWSPF